MKYKVTMLIESKRTLAMSLQEQIRDKVNEYFDTLVREINVKPIQPSGEEEKT